MNTILPLKVFIFAFTFKYSVCFLFLKAFFFIWGHLISKSSVSYNDRCGFPSLPLIFSIWYFFFFIVLVLLILLFHRRFMILWV
ncbi:hypothetical protein GLYMA_18G012100v4 [Glycine max]|uniref:Uncharacterized protein n=1 Tax=Glycine max TaxID=3847 RepID=A0A0R0EUR3_SOYBN|nr:hypothetical protein JHK85_049655 [Glycine max]KAH1152670.1 hypothetical protein GYH30_048667 [Glycine max]KRG97504.1 hypothetical protein GLYMA_18G012100v4 [Glycine max]